MITIPRLRFHWAVAYLVTTTNAVLAASAVDTSALRNAVTVAGIQTHRQALQDIADANGDTRAAGTPGYNASATYVANLMQAYGYSVTVQEFDFLFVGENSPSAFEQVTPVAVVYTRGGTGFFEFTFSGNGDVTAPVTPVDVILGATMDDTSTSGCEAADFAGFPVGNIALIQRGTCSFEQKVINAEAAGASGVILFNEGSPGRTLAISNGTLGSQRNIPTVSTSYDIGAELATSTGVSARIKVDVIRETRTTSNVLAESAPGCGDDVLMLGAHLDSVLRGPGIQDNGSGTATILELAIQLAELGIRPRQTVRFAWWGGGELSNLGSQFYLDSLSPEDRERITLYLNFDMIGSPNYVRFVYDGDGSASGNPGPAGSEEAEQTFLDYFADQGLMVEPIDWNSVRSDHNSFSGHGIPIGGLFTGAEVIKTQELAAVYGGTAGQQFDPCYHLACDTYANISEVALDQMSDAAAHALLTFALDPVRCAVNRVSSTQKGSVLIYSKIEVKWDASGNLIQDTFLDMTNDYPAGVTVQGYFINGDIELDELLDTNGGLVQSYEPGWNTADCRFELTANQPHYWSAANGSDKCQRFTVLDDDGPGRPDPEVNDGSRILRGYAIFWAVAFKNNVWLPIHWNHLKGDAVLVNYANGTAWEYNAWSFQARTHLGGGTPPQPCDSGDDPYSQDRWVVCAADNQTAWLSHAVEGGGLFHPQAICQQLGYAGYGAFGGTCNNVCGYCEKSDTSCESPGVRFFDEEGLGKSSDEHGDTLSSSVTWECVNFTGRAVQHGDPVSLGPELLLDGNSFDAPFASLLLDFYASGSTVLSGGGQTVMVDTDLTLHAVSADLRQDGCGPVLTKVEAEIWNESESKFSGTRRCICCWDQTMLSDWVRSALIPNHFMREALRTDKGKARLNGVHSTECDYEAICGTTAKMKRWNNCADTMVPRVAGLVSGNGSFDGSEDAAILGLATKFIAFTPSGAKDAAGMNLVGAGTEPALIQYDPMFGPEELRTGDGSKATGAHGIRRPFQTK